MSVRYHSVGPYEVLSRLGSGGMADVLMAVDGRDGRTVALKIPKTEPGVREAEREGARLQMRLSEIDPRVPRVFEIEETAESEMYIAMEYVEGEDLSERIRRGPLDPREAARIATELCELLTAAQHCSPTGTRQGIVHGDLKPKNVRLEPSGGVRVLDFGIAKALSLTRPLTRNEFGSLPYSSPERIDTGNVDAHSDLWSVSVVLYEMLTGQQPFRGESTRRLEEHIRSRTLPPEMDASCPRALVAVLHKALAPALERRYPDAAALHADLTAFLEGRDTEAERECSVAARYEETRRTVGPEGEREGAGTRRTLEASGNGSSPAEAETRRTLPEGSAAAGAISPSPPAPPEGTAAQTAPRASGRRFRVSWKLVVLLAGVLLVANEAQVMSAATELKGALPGLPRGEADAVWKRYRQLRARSLLRVGSFGLGRDVRDWFVASADELIADYRSDTPVIRENGWRSAISLLGRAASIAPRDRAVKARLLYCRGQLARIDAQAAKDRRPADATRRFNEATHDFEEAARLGPRWIDPQLGLARTYVYGLEDPERARGALDRAEEDGYELGSRDMALLGDGYRLRAEKTWARIANLRDLPDEERYLKAVREDCEQALDQYKNIPAFGEVSHNIRRVRDLLDRVERREDERREDKLRKLGLGILAPLLGRSQ